MTQTTTLSKAQLDQFHQEGYLVIKGMRSQEFCRQYVDEIWRAICHAPWVPGQGIPAIPSGPFASLKGKQALPQDKEWLKSMKIGKASETRWFPGGFSAPAIPPMFHLAHSWANRQAPDFYQAFSQLLSQESGKDLHRLWCSIDRVSVKPPGMGDQDEFYHWDSDPWFWDRDSYVGLQGMLSLSAGNCFTLFRGSHTLAFRDWLVDRETGILRNHPQKPNWASHGDRGQKEAMTIIPDEFQADLNDRRQVVSLEQGDLIIWSNRLLHLASKNRSDGMRYAQYIQFDPAGMAKDPRDPEGTYQNQNPELFPDGDREEIRQSYRKLGVSHYEVDDRIQSFLTGKKPLVYPSGGLSDNALRPNIWKSQFKHLNTRYARRFQQLEENPTREIVQYQNSKTLDAEGKYQDKLLGEKSYPYQVKEWDPRKTLDPEGQPLYQVPTLTELGEKLLGLRCWD